MLKNNKYFPFIIASLFIITCSIVSLAGFVGGVMFGMTYGSNLPVFSNYGDGFGYEGSGMLGGYIGSAIISIIIIFLWFKKSLLLKKLLILFIIYWIFMVVIQNIIAATVGEFYFILYLTPIILTGIAYIYLQSLEKHD